MAKIIGCLAWLNTFGLMWYMVLHSESKTFILSAFILSIAIAFISSNLPKKENKKNDE